jgi:membrane-associated phospholipid phosphatase
MRLDFRVFALFIVFFAVLSYFYIDYYLAIYFHDNMTQNEYKIWDIITEIGDSLYVVVISLGLMLFYRHKKELFFTGYYLFASIVMSGLITNIVKFALGRPRPILFLKNSITEFNPFTYDHLYFSMPSGHTTTAFAFFVALSIVYPKYKYLFISIAILAGISRVVLQKHYLSDILVGALIGFVSAIILYNSYFKKKLA